MNVEGPLSYWGHYWLSPLLPGYEAPILQNG